MFRKSILRLVVVGLMLLFTVSTFAQKPEGKSKRKLESWYFMYSLSKAVDKGDKGMVSLDLTDDLMFYLSLNSKALLGISFYGTGYEKVDIDLNLAFYLYSVSMQYYFKSIGDGFFLQGNLGRAIGLSFNEDNLPESIEARGYGFLLGAGYALPLSSESSIIFSLGYRLNRIQEKNFVDFALNIGLLW